jgi:hypothetical protein
MNDETRVDEAPPTDQLPGANRPRWIHPRDVTRLIKRALKSAFPNTRFTVRYRPFGYTTVEWVDGPERILVADIAQKFDGADPENITGFHVTGVRICDHCKDPGKEAFPYHVTDPAGQVWGDLCNECFDLLGCTYEDGPRDDICPPNAHDWAASNRGLTCQACGLTIPFSPADPDPVVIEMWQGDPALA